MTPLGLENGAISDTQIDASSQLDSTHSAKQARLHSKADGSKWGSWSALTNDLSQWLQVDLSTYTRVTRVATQGSNGFYQWVTKYNLQYSDDGDKFHSFEEPGNNGAKVYPNYMFRKSLPPMKISSDYTNNHTFFTYFVSLSRILRF